MGKTAESIDRWLGRASGAYSFWPLLPPGIIAVTTGYFASGVAWINQFGAFGWLSSGLLAFLIANAALALSGRARLWRVQAKDRSRISGGSSPFDPMDNIFENKRILVSDLVNPYDQVVDGKKFINCEIIGPANIVAMLGQWKFIGNNLTHCDSIEMRDDAVPQNVIAFANCDFERCKFFKITFLFQTKFRSDADKIISNMHWITVSEQPKLIEDQSDAKTTGFERLIRRLTGGDGSS